MSDEIPQPHRGSLVTLREITKDTLKGVLQLKVLDSQDRFVASNAVSIAQAHFEGEGAWLRAIYADETPVGFVMLWLEPTTPLYYVWRFMIDGRYQRLGFGRQAMGLVVDHVRALPNATQLKLSYVPGDGCPQPFYASLGFAETGVWHDEEKEMVLAL